MNTERANLSDEVLHVLRKAWRDYSARSAAEEVADWAAAREKALREEIAADLLAQAARCSDIAENARHSTWPHLVSEYSACARTYDHAARIARGSTR